VVGEETQEWRIRVSYEYEYEYGRTDIMIYSPLVDEIDGEELK